MSTRLESLRANGCADNVVLVSGVSSFGRGSGLGLYRGEYFELIDPIPTAACIVGGDGSLLRVLCSPPELGASGEMLVYDAKGASVYARLDFLADAHDATAVGEGFILTSAMNNSIHWVTGRGDLLRQWRAPGEPDSWHVNGVISRGGKTYVSAFGIFEKHREWNSHNEDGSGIIYDIDECRPVITGLDCPHNPLQVEEGWLVCNSARYQLLLISERTNERVRTLQLNRWTRGLAVSDDLIFVGGSFNRKVFHVGDAAELFVIDRRSWELVDRCSVPFQEVTSLCVVPKVLVEALRRGFRTNPYRENNFSLYNMFQKVGTDPVRLAVLSDPLPLEALKSRIEATAVPGELAANSVTEVRCLVRNLGIGTWICTAPHPVFLSYHWHENGNGGQIIEGRRTRLPRIVPPGYSLECDVTVVAPPAAGIYDLRISLVQEWIAWFDDVDESNGCSQQVTIL